MRTRLSFFFYFRGKNSDKNRRALNRFFPSLATNFHFELLKWANYFFPPLRSLFVIAANLESWKKLGEVIVIE